MIDEKSRLKLALDNATAASAPALARRKDLLEKHKDMLLGKARADTQEFWVQAYEGNEELMNSDRALLDTYFDAMYKYDRHRGLYDVKRKHKFHVAKAWDGQEEQIHFCSSVANPISNRRPSPARPQLYCNNDEHGMLFLHECKGRPDICSCGEGPNNPDGSWNRSAKIKIGVNFCPFCALMDFEVDQDIWDDEEIARKLHD